MSMTGGARAWGNRTDYPAGAVKDALSSLPMLKGKPDAELEKYARRMRFFIQPGDADRFMAVAAVIAELTGSGFVKVALVADTPGERDALASFLRLTRAGLGNVAATVYQPPERRGGIPRDVCAEIYGYLTSPGPEILLMDVDSFCRKTNLLRRAVFGPSEGGESPMRSLADLAGEGRPALICCARTADSARNLWRAASVLKPSVSFLICGEEIRLRDAVICGPGYGTADTGEAAPKREELPEQLGF